MSGGGVRRILPHSKDGEESVLGGILFSGRAITLVADLVDAADFYDARHEAIYAAMVDLDQKSRPIDLITVAEQMRQSGTMAKLAASDSEVYLSDLANKVATVENIAQHARIIRAKATARRLILEASGIVDQGYEAIEVEEYIDHAQQVVFEIANRSNRQSYEPVRKILHNAIKGDRAALQPQGSGHRGALGLPRVRRHDLGVSARRPHHHCGAAVDGQDRVCHELRPERRAQPQDPDAGVLPGDVQGVAHRACAVL